MQADLKALLKQVRVIIEHAITIRQADDYVIFTRRKETRILPDEVNSVVREYSNARNVFNHFGSLRKWDTRLRPICTTSSTDATILRGLLREIEIECGKAIGLLDDMVSALPTEELDKLKMLRKELENTLSYLDDVNYEKNLAQAIDEYEKGHVLGSTLISSRVIIYALDKIPGKEAEDKVKFLDEKKIIDKKGKDPGEFILKANKKARNFFSHDIKAFPDPSDALSLLGDSIAILRIICRFEEASKSQNLGK